VLPADSKFFLKDTGIQLFLKIHPSFFIDQNHAHYFFTTLYNDIKNVA